MSYHCEPFDLDDVALIEGARATGRPEHVAEAIEAAVSGFRARMQRRGLAPIVNGELVIFVIKPRNYFDDYCQAIVFQEISNATGLGVVRVMMSGRGCLKQPASPDVEFIVQGVGACAG